MRTIAALAVSCSVLLVTPPVFAAEPTLQTDDQKTLYAIGMSLARNLATFGLTKEELAVVVAGMEDELFAPEPKVDIEVYGPKIQGFAQARAKVAADAEKQRSATFLADAAKKPGATKTASGLVYRETKAGGGEQPKPTDKVKVHYHGTLTDGTVFDSSKERGEPAVFPLNGVIPCWTEGVALMKVGGTATLVCPSDLAYGDRGAPPKIKPGATLVFDVELLEIVKSPPPSTAPSGVPGVAPSPEAGGTPKTP